MTTRSALRHDIAKALNDEIVLSTVNGTQAGTSLVDTDELLHVDDDILNGDEVFIYAGTGLGQSRRITDYIASSSLVTVPTWTTTPVDDDSQYEIHRRWRVREYDAAIDAAHDIARLKHLLPKVDESIILDNRAANGLMATWTSSSALTGWGAGGVSPTLAQESDNTYGRFFSAKLSNSNDESGTLEETIVGGETMGGETVTIRAWVYNVTATRVRSYVVYKDDDASVQTKYSSYHDGKGWNAADDLLITQTIGPRQDILSQEERLRTGIEIASGSVIDAYLGRFEFTSGKEGLLSDHIYEYDIPSGFVSITQVERETGAHNVFEPLRADYDYEIVPDSTRRLHIASPIAGRALRITGLQKATKPTADTSTIELNEEFVKAYACWYLLMSKPQEGESQKLAYWANLSSTLLRQMANGIKGKVVETVG